MSVSWIADAAQPEDMEALIHGEIEGLRGENKALAQELARAQRQYIDDGGQPIARPSALSRDSR